MEGGSTCDRRASSCRYKLVLGKARKFELEQHGVILCTCSCAASRSLKKLAVRQILVDEAGMATEPETLIPLVTFSQAEKVSSWAVRRRAQGGCLWEGSAEAVELGTRGLWASGLCLPVPPGGSSWGPQAAAACGQE